MKRLKFISPLILLAFVVLFSCNNDDDNGVIVVPPRERDEEAVAAQIEIEEFLETHFYNYEEFENPPVDFDKKIVFDTIANENASKTPLIDQVDYKMVTDIRDENVTYKLYYLSTVQGGGDDINFVDIATMTYEGRFMSDLSLFDSSVVPIRFDLTQIVDGLQSALVEFKGAVDFVENTDGTITFEDFGVGAVFIPSGLGYFNTPPSSIPYYTQLIFTFQTFLVEKGDQDSDGVLSYIEDLDGDGFEGNDDTDSDGIPNFADSDDDGDGRLTKNETELVEYIIILGGDEPSLGENQVEMYRELDDETGEVTIYTVIFTDGDSNGIADYLDKDY